MKHAPRFAWSSCGTAIGNGTDPQCGVVLDTNILLSALIRRDSVPGRIIEAWFDDHFVLLTHDLQLEELRTVTRRPQIRTLIRAAEAGRLVNQLRAQSELVTRLPPTSRSDDPADDFLLAM